MELEEALTKIATLEADKADALRNFAAYRKIAEKNEGELKEQLDTVEKESADKLDSVTKEFDGYKKSIEDTETTRRSSFMDKKIEEMSKGDKKISDSLKAEYALLNMPEDSEASIGARLDKARLIINVASPTSAAEAAGAGSGATGGD